MYGIPKINLHNQDIQIYMASPNSQITIGVTEIATSMVLSKCFGMVNL